MSTTRNGWTLEDPTYRGGQHWRGPHGERVPAIAGSYDGGASIYIMIALTVAAAAASAYAQYSASEAQSQAMKYNAQESERQAEMAAEQAKFAAQQQTEKDKRTRAAARAIQGTSGVEVGEGSSLLVDLDSARQAELNYQSIRYQGESQVRNLTSQAQLDRFQARSTQRQGLIGAGSTLLAAGASIAGKMYTPRTTATPKTITVPSDYGTGGLD
jgi:type II secretory pathway component PulK